tara:strand:+ start:223 stop:474 length:252 start_codon:yes stop_codon:yes gene_type:complete
MDNLNNPPKKPKKRRQRNSDGTFKSQNEIKPVDAELLDKPAGKYSITKKIKGTTQGQTTAGKYANNKKDPVRPDFKGIKTVYH